MKFIYPAIFHKTEEGTYEGYFPDLECRSARGDTLDEAVGTANEAATDWITLELSEEEPDLPYITDVADLPLKEGDVVRQISVNIRFYEGWDE